MPKTETMSRASAQSVLGVPSDASPDEIRAVWKKRAFELHPDRGNDTTQEFLAAKAAYAVLSSLSKDVGVSANADARPTPKATPDFVEIRPGVRRINAATCERVSRVSDAQKAACREVFGDGGTGLVADEVRQRGRNIAFVVNGALSGETVQVAVPTGFLVDVRKVAPVIVSLRTDEIVNGRFVVQEPMRTAQFPGARKVEIRFDGSPE